MNFSNVKEWTIPEGSVSKVTDSLGRVIWEKQGGQDYSKDYFFVEDASGSNNTITFRKINNTSAGDAPKILVYKSTDQTNWSSLGYITKTGLTVTIPANSKVYFMANTAGWSDPDYPGTFFNQMRSTSDYKVGGNIMSLLKGARFYGSDFTGCNAYCLHNIFSGNLIDASNLVLPATSLIKGCYKDMFYGCSALTSAPALPATTLAESCYSGMFFGSRLTVAPALPVTTLANQCYSSMFRGCRSLTTAPALPATTLIKGCYFSMFEGCTALTTAPALPATTLAINCYENMFYGCTSLTAAPALPVTTLVTSCYYGMFYGCSALTEVPD